MSKSSDKRALIISPTPTHPTTAGNRVRILNLSKALARIGVEAHFLYLPYEGPPTQELLDYWGENLLLFKPSKGYRTPARRKFHEKILSKSGFKKFKFNRHIDDWFDDSLLEFLKALQAKEKFHYVICEYVFLSKALQAFGEGTVKIIDTHDIFTNRYKIYETQNLSSNWYSTYRKDEALGLGRADLIFAIQEEEAAFFKKLTNKPIFTIGHFIEYTQPVSKEFNGQILFLGSNNIINEKTLQYFLEKIKPILHQKGIPHKLVIAGGITKRLKMPSEDSIEIAPAPVQLNELYQKADIVINPILAGTGLKIKTLEAIAHGKPVVGTPAALHGLGKDWDKVALLGRNETEFAHAIELLFESPKLREELSNNSKEFILQYDEKHFQALERALIETAIAKDIIKST